jgi:hypothetical protein
MALVKLYGAQQNFISKEKKILVSSCNSQGIIHKEFLPPSQTVNKEYYVEVLSCLVERIHEVRPSFREEDAAPSCTTAQDLTLQY